MKTFLIVLVLFNFYLCQNFDEYIYDLDEPHEVEKRAATPRKYVHTKDELNLTKEVPKIEPLTCDTQPIAVFVYSTPESIGKYFDIRQAIRSTWINETKARSISVFFAIGLNANQTVNKEVEDESNKYHDIIQFKFLDDFYNRTLKTISIFRWVNRKCLNSTHIIKVDDDVVVNTQYLLGDLWELKNGFTGHLYTNKSVERDPNSPYHMPSQFYAKELFPDFVSGRAYIMSQNITLSILQAIDSYTGNVLDIEDVFITGIIPETNGILRHKMKGSKVPPSPSAQSCDVCLLFRNYFIYQCSDPQLIQTLWSEWMSTTHEHCKKGVRIRKYGHTIEEIELTKDPVIDAKPCKNVHPISVFIHSLNTVSRFENEAYRRRQAQKDTWVKELRDHGVNVYYVLGTSADDQFSNTDMIDITTDNIIQYSFIDDIYNQTLKSIAILRWINKNCFKSKYILKVDDEVVINTHKFLYHSLDLKPGIMGFLTSGERPDRNRRSQRYMPEQYYPNDTYPDFMFRPTYIMENSFTPALLKVIDSYSGPILDIDDVFMTGILPKAIGIPLNDDNNTSLEYLGCDNVCPLFDHLVVSFCLNDNKINVIWDQFITSSIDMCTAQNNTRRNYAHTKEELALTKAQPTLEPQPCNDVQNISVFIDSKPQSSDKRQALRRTWIRELKRHNITVYFALGLDPTVVKEVRDEYDKHHDIIQFPFDDDYYNRTLKAISIIRWVNKKCQTSEHILKVDDNVIVNTEHLLSQLLELKEGFEGFGDETKDVKVDRNIEHKWFIPKQYYTPEEYPFFVREGAYIIAQNITQTLEMAVDSYPGSILDLEAPFITGILPRHNQSNEIHSFSDGRFVFVNKFGEGCAPEYVCKLFDAFVVFECLNASQMLNFWVDWKTTTREECIKTIVSNTSVTTPEPTNETTDCNYDWCEPCPEQIQCPPTPEAIPCPIPKEPSCPAPDMTASHESHSVWHWIKVGFFVMIGIVLAIIALLVIAFVAGFVGYGVYRVIDSFAAKDDVHPKQPEGPAQTRL